MTYFLKISNSFIPVDQVILNSPY